MKKYKIIKDYPGCMLKIGDTIEFESKEFPIKFKEFYEEIIDQDYEILLYRNPKYNIFNKYKIIDSDEIYSIKRLSNGEIFSVGDKTICGNITNFNLCNNELEIYTNSQPLTTKALLSNLIHLKKLLFTTEDGINIYKEDKFYSLNIKDFKTISLLVGNENQKKGLASSFGYLWFSTKEKAQEYIELNKPCLSMKDCLDWATFSEEARDYLDLDKLKQLVKQKLETHE